MAQTGGHSLWHKDAIIYELHVKAFRDSNGDGVGDFKGLIEKLDYLQDLGVTTLWLLPFYPSPMRDDGYDISDYYSIAPQYGTIRDFKLFMKEAHRRGLKVITELVINHTSDQHPWFQAARRSPKGSPERDFYVWSDTDKKFEDTRIIFCDTEPSNWTWDPIAGQYYWHRFFSHQPDLNHNNPEVVKAVIKVMNFWLDMGVDGVRLDAIPYLCVREGTNNENLPETHEVLKEMRRQLDAKYQDRVFLAEANQWPAEVRHYFGNADECHMAFHFPVMPRIFMALRREDRTPIVDILERTPAIPDSCQWAIFLRNHDELTLEMVTDEERDYMYREYAKDPRMRINLGIRRRLAPLVDNSRRRMQVLNSLLLSFPGSPVIYYGDEIGMGDNIYLGDRNGVRTPMHWSIDRNGGFSEADPGKLYHPLIMDPVYGYLGVNVEAQERDRSSVLQFMKRLISLRRQYKAFGRGTIEFLYPKNKRILAYLRKYKDEVILCVVNLSRFSQPVELDLSAYKGWVPLEMMGKTEFPAIADAPYFLSLGQHTFFWFKLEPESQPIHISHRGKELAADLPALTVEGSFDAIFERPVLQNLEMDVLPAYLNRCRWFQGKARQIISVRVLDEAKIGVGFHWTLIEVKYEEGEAEIYSLPLKMALGTSAVKIAADVPHGIVARLRSGNEIGVLFDALTDQNSGRTLLASIADQRKYRSLKDGEIRSFVPALALGWESNGFERDMPVKILEAEQSNTSIFFGQQSVLKIFRQLEAGPNPDLEISEFLLEKVDFVPRLLGGLEFRLRSGESYTLGMLQEYVGQTEDCWAYSLRELENYLKSTNSGGEITQIPSGYADFLTVLARRTAELHIALSEESRNRDFAPEKMSADRLELMSARCTEFGRSALELLSSALPSLSAENKELASQVLAKSASLLERFQNLRGSVPELVSGAGLWLIRIHGDYHLGQVLKRGEDVVILDFEGEPQRPIRERRKKRCVLRDVAGMLRSFSYAAEFKLGELRVTDSLANSSQRRQAGQWLALVSESFCNEYAKVVSGQSFYPANPGFAKTMLNAYSLDKVFYELRYELSYRPEWVAVPLRGLLNLAEAK